MKAESYNWVWENIILKSIKNIASAVKDELEKCQTDINFHLVYDYDMEGECLNTKKAIENQYVKIRDELKRMCYCTDQISLHTIDQHKIAACFCKTLIQKKVFAFDITNDTPDCVLTSNYSLAYAVSLQIVYMYMCESYNRNKQLEYLRNLKNNKSLLGPKTTHEPYHEGRIKSLALNDYYGIEINLLSYADTMFWIETYNRQLVECK